MRLVKDYKTENFFEGKTNSCEYILLHHTWPGKWINIVKYLCRKESGVSAHYVVDIDGTIYQLADDEKCTWHAGKSSYDGKSGFNLYSIGIEVVSDGKNFTDAQREAVRELVKNLMKKHNILSSMVIRHKDVAPGRKRDIGDNFWNNQFSSFAEWQKSLDAEEPELAPEALEMMKLWVWNGQRAKEPATREEVAIMLGRLVRKFES